MIYGGWNYHILPPLSSQEYDMNTVSKELELRGAFLLGAAGAPSQILGMNAEVTRVQSHHNTGFHSHISI